MEVTIEKIATAFESVDSDADGDIVWWHCIRTMDILFPGLCEEIHRRAELPQE